MAPEISEASWFKSSHSSVSGCVEVAHLPGGGVGVRDSKNKGGETHTFAPADWAAFVAGVASGDVNPDAG